MPQDQCQCQSGSHGHEPGECKNEMTHEEDQMCDYCHDKAADLLSMLPPENSFRRSGWNGVQRVGVLITLGRCPKHTSRPIGGEAISSTLSPGITPTGA